MRTHRSDELSLPAGHKRRPVLPSARMLRRIRGWKKVVHDAVDFTVDLVEEGHESVGRNAMRVVGWVAPLEAPARLVNELRRASTSLALDSVRGVNRLVERLTDAGLDSVVALELLPWLQAPSVAPIEMRSDITGSSAWLSDSAIAALNGAVGDYLHREGNALDLGLSLRYRDAYLDPAASPPTMPPRIAVFVHGLGATEWSWCWGAAECHGDAAQCFGTLLERDTGLAPIYARYNSGRRVFENGQLLAEALESLFTSRADPYEEIVLCGHSMGGLVVQSACHYASTRGHAWVRRVSRVFSFGSPHRGAPLEQIGAFATTVLGGVDLPGTRIPAEILRRRSAGVRDLARGTIADGDVQPELLDHIAYYFLSATVTQDPDHPVGWLIGDVLVRVPSASGPPVIRTDLRVETRCFGGVAHLQIQNHPAVYDVLLGACQQPLPRAAPSGSKATS
jgi:triacylglycerol lipase